MDKLDENHGTMELKMHIVDSDSLGLRQNKQQSCSDV